MSAWSVVYVLQTQAAQKSWPWTTPNSGPLQTIGSGSKRRAKVEALRGKTISGAIWSRPRCGRAALIEVPEKK